MVEKRFSGGIVQLFERQSHLITSGARAKENNDQTGSITLPQFFGLTIGHSVQMQAILGLESKSE
jgi:hypothetical protein